MRVEVLYFDGCPGHEALMPRLRQLLAARDTDAEIELRRIDTLEAAQAARFLGSPTLRIEGEDVDPGAAAREDYGMKCRLYRSPAGASPTPPDEWIEAALARASA